MYSTTLFILDYNVKFLSMLYGIVQEVYVLHETVTCDKMIQIILFKKITV